MPLALVLEAVKKYTGHSIVTIGEDVGFHAHCFADDAFDSEAAGIDFGFNALNGDAPAAV
jgi:hypothetical protein